MSETTKDMELLRRCLTGRTESFAVLVGRYQSLVCAITYGATGNVHRSEELAQETFLLAWKNLHQLKDPAKFKAWLCRIARNVIQNWLRKRQHDVASKAAPLETAASQPSAAAPPEEVAIQEEQQAVVNQALEIIPEHYRLPLILFYRENKSTREVAELLGLNENSTRQRISRARAQLKRQVSAMVETTLAQSKPGKAFTAGVVASLAGIAVKGTATAVAAGTVATGMSSLALKAAGIAAGMLLIAGVGFTVYQQTRPEPAPTLSPVVSPAEPPVVAPVSPSQPVDQNTGLPTATADPKQLNTVVETGTQAQPITRWNRVRGSSTSVVGNTPYEFKPMGVLSGLITDAVTGEPVQDAALRISNDRRQDVRTDAHGFYHVDSIDKPGSCTIYIDSDDYVGYGLNANAPKINLSPDQQFVQHFQLPRACKVRVQVVDANDVPIRGVEVIPTSLTDSRSITINAHGLRRTDHQGCVLLGGIPPSADEYMITAIAEKYDAVTSPYSGRTIEEIHYTHCPAKAIVRLTDPNATTDVKIVLEQGQAVHGYVEYSDGVPAKDIRIGVQPTWWHCMSTNLEDLYLLNSDGTFVIPHVVPDTYNITRMTLNPDGLPLSSKVVMQKTLPLADDEPLFVRLSMSSSQARSSVSTSESRHLPRQGDRPSETRLQLTGFVADGRTQEPITQFQIRVRTLKSLSGDTSRVAQDWILFNHSEGRFTLDKVGAGLYQIQALAGGYAPGWSDTVNTADNQEVFIPLSQGGQLTGLITNHAGEPVDNAKVIPLSWACATHPAQQHLFTDEKGSVLTENGVFTLPHLPEGSETIKIVHPNYAPQKVQAIEIEAGQTAQVNDIVLASGGTVEGFVLDEQDQPVVNQTLCFSDARSGTTSNASHRLATVVTDANGFYRVSHLPALSCYVYRDDMWKMRGVARRVVTPLEGQTVRLDFGGSFKVRGHFDNPHGTFTQRRLVLRAILRANFECFTLTDEQGQFTFSGIVPGSYTLAYEDPNSRARWNTVTSVTVEEDDLDLGVLAQADTLSEEQQNKAALSAHVSSEPTLRTLALKLPLEQPALQWTFMSEADTLAGKLTLRITREEKTVDIIVFENGHFAEGWQAMRLPLYPKAGEIRYRFTSSQQYFTSPDDTLELQWQVPTDLDGIGRFQTGILPAGVYKTRGTYTVISDEYQVPDAFKAFPQDTVARLKAENSYTAFMEKWQTQWPLQITSDEGWLDPRARARAERIQKLLKGNK
jgi:RNA polymerase sigma factor (sigma-70 family)